MNKGELASAFAKNAGLSTTEAAQMLDTVFNLIATALKKGDEVRISGFGTFSVTERASEARSPCARETVTTPANKEPRFTASAGLKDLMSSRPSTAKKARGPRRSRSPWTQSAPQPRWPQTTYWRW